MKDPYLTNWERRQHDADGGQRAALAQAHTDLAAFILADGNGPLPPAPQAVDAWAARHRLTAAWADGTYQATATFGPLAWTVFYQPARTADEQRARDSYRGNVRTAA
jgi:hypothetical protein